MSYHHLQHKKLKKSSHTFDSVVAVVAILSPLTTLPQIFQIYQVKNVQGISLVTWIFSIAISTMWAFYGQRHNDKPILFNSAMGAVLSCAVVVGIIAYR